MSTTRRDRLYPLPATRDAATTSDAQSDQQSAADAFIRDQLKRERDQRRGCTCPSDCNCHHAHRTNYCGCREH